MPSFMISLLFVGLFIVYNIFDVHLELPGSYIIDFMFTWGLHEHNSLSAFSMRYSIANYLKLCFWSMIWIHIIGHIVFRIVKKYDEYKGIVGNE